MRTLALGTLLMFAGFGCFHFQPVGPFAKELGSGPAPSSAANDGSAAPAKDASARPMVKSAPAPTPPALLVSPGEVTESNYRQAARRLMEELEADRKSMEAMPMPS